MVVLKIFMGGFRPTRNIKAIMRKIVSRIRHSQLIKEIKEAKKEKKLNKDK
jgi:hypothetical protein